MIDKPTPRDRERVSNAPLVPANDRPMATAHITRLATFAQHGEPKDYGGSDMMRADLEALIRAIPPAEATNDMIDAAILCANEWPRGQTDYGSLYKAMLATHRLVRPMV